MSRTHSYPKKENLISSSICMEIFQIAVVLGTRFLLAGWPEIFLNFINKVSS